jgi:hypothetical protein
MTNKVLVIFSGNYDDEFDYQAVQVKDDWFYTTDDPRLEGLDLDREYEVYFGTNESIFVTIRDIIRDSEAVELLTEREEELVRRFSSPFDRVLDLIDEKIHELEEKRELEKNKTLWNRLTEEKKSAYRQLWKDYSDLPFVNWYNREKPENQEIVEKRKTLVTYYTEMWADLGLLGLPLSPSNLE